ncbi:hypothetical protein CMV37_35655, partial [Bacillus cereus]
FFAVKLIKLQLFTIYTMIKILTEDRINKRDDEHEILQRFLSKLLLFTFFIWLELGYKKC